MAYAIPDHDEARSIYADGSELAVRLEQEHTGDRLAALHRLYRERPADGYDAEVRCLAREILLDWCHDAERRAWMLWLHSPDISPIAAALARYHTERVV